MEWSVVPFVIVCDLGAQAALQRRVFFTSCLRGGQLADGEERSDERDHLCFGLELLIQPLRQLNMLKAIVSVSMGCYDCSQGVNLEITRLVHHSQVRVLEMTILCTWISTWPNCSTRSGRTPSR